MGESRERAICTKRELDSVENPPGIHRTTMAYSEELMLCHFSMKKGAEIPLHNHQAVQNGYVVSGRLQFRNPAGDWFVAAAGTGYNFSSLQEHGLTVLEDAEVIEVFAPLRPEYADN